MSAEVVRHHLLTNGVPFECHSHATAYSTRETAAVSGVPPEQMAKVVLLDVDDRLVMAVVPGNRMVDLGRAETALGASSVMLAAEQQFALAFPDCEPGAEPPFGLLYGIQTVVDNRFVGERITFAAGSHRETITMALEDYLSLANPLIADLTGPDTHLDDQSPDRVGARW